MLVVPAVLLFGATILAFCWFFGSAIAQSADSPEAAEAAIFFAPADPSGHNRLALLKNQSFNPADAPGALPAATRGVALAPNDWRQWHTVAQLRERAGDGDGAELAARYAVKLAPNYAQTQWLLGNILLRRAQPVEGLAQMRRAAEADAKLIPAFVNTTAQSIGTSDLAALSGALGDSPPIRAALALYLAQDKKFDEAVQIWQNLPGGDKSIVAKDLTQTLMTAKKHRAALTVHASTLEKALEKPQAEQFINPGFENEISVGAANSEIFSWQIADGANPQIAVDASTKHGGNRSLVILFSSVSGAEFRAVSQLLVVEPGASYQLETWAKTANLKLGGGLQWEIVSGADDKILAKSSALASGGEEWRRLTAEFVAPRDAEAVIVRLAATPCSVSPCAMNGKVWFDDFNLRKK